MAILVATSDMQGHGWWQASDDLWYPPESHPQYAPPPPPHTEPQRVPASKVSSPSYNAPPIQLSPAVPNYAPQAPSKASAFGATHHPPPVSSNKSPQNAWKWVAGGLAALLTVTLFAILVADSDAPNDVAQDTDANSNSEEVDELVPAQEPQVETTTAPEIAVSPEPTLAPTTAAPALMPNVVCMNLQVAQDTIQETGVFFSRSQDAGGGDRFQIIDSNSLVVAQSPTPGTPFAEGEAMLDVVKLGEPNDC